MRTVCERDMCVGCMACVESCPKKAISIQDTLISYNAVIDTESCVDCNICHKVCQNNNDILYTKPYLWKQGWANKQEIRSNSASGGLATEISLSFIKNNGIVCSCTFEEGRFCFDFAYTVDDVSKFAGSKYVKSAPAGVYKKIKDLLIMGKEVLFIGLPCQVEALKLFIGEGICSENLYTIDLICHGSPSPNMLNKFLEQYGTDLQSVSKLKFRCNNKYGLTDSDGYLPGKYACDRYTIAFLNGLIFTENCYQCKFAKEERVSDLTLGDSWGSQLPLIEREKGISLVLCQSEKGQELLEHSDLYLVDVERGSALSHNHQLMNPSLKPEFREEFFNKINKGKKFNRLIRKYYPKTCLKQKMKSILISCHLIKK